MDYLFQSPQRLYFVMPFIKGGELYKVFKAQKRLSEEVVKFYAAQICMAVGYLHSKGIMHRDLKLENILVKDGSTKRIKVADFGMARDCNPNSMCLTKGMGTVSYMAPEVAAPDALAPYDGAAADVWSIGVMLYVMLVCNYPFGHDGEILVCVHV